MRIALALVLVLAVGSASARELMQQRGRRVGAPCLIPDQVYPFRSEYAFMHHIAVSVPLLDCGVQPVAACTTSITTT